jgi:hypothetical protein
MKSKRAQKELEKLEKFYPFSGWIAPSDTYRIVEIAERDAEKRMRRKAMEAFDDMWINGGEPDYELQRNRFIQKLNENGND